MGWLITDGATRADIIRTRIQPWTNTEGVSGRCLRKCLRGNVLWTVWERTHPTAATDRYIGCDLLGTDGEGNWGYKDLDESMGPVDLTCPIEYFDLVPPTNPGWRASVLASRFRGSLQIGDRVQLRPGYTPAELTITSLRPLRGRHPDHGVFRIQRRAIAHCLPAAPARPDSSTTGTLFP